MPKTKLSGSRNIAQCHRLNIRVSGSHLQVSFPWSMGVLEASPKSFTRLPPQRTHCSPQHTGPPLRTRAHSKSAPAPLRAQAPQRVRPFTERTCSAALLQLAVKQGLHAVALPIASQALQSLQVLTLLGHEPLRARQKAAACRGAREGSGNTTPRLPPSSNVIKPTPPSFDRAF